MTLEALRKQTAECIKCDLHCSRTNIVFGDGHSDRPILMILGEGPGEEEDLEGRSLIGQCGKKLDQMLTYAGLERDEVYITNAVMCRPPKNRNPLMKEIEACRPRLLQQIKEVNPQILVVMGRIGLQALTGKPLKGALSKYFETRFRDMTIGGNPGRYVVTYHPSYLIRKRSIAYQPMLQHWTDIKNEVARIKSQKD